MFSAFTHEKVRRYNDFEFVQRRPGLFIGEGLNSPGGSRARFRSNADPWLRLDESIHNHDARCYTLFDANMRATTPLSSS